MLLFKAKPVEQKHIVQKLSDKQMCVPADSFTYIQQACKQRSASARTLKLLSCLVGF